MKMSVCFRDLIFIPNPMTMSFPPLYKDFCVTDPSHVPSSLPGVQLLGRKELRVLLH